MLGGGSLPARTVLSGTILRFLSGAFTFKLAKLT